MSNPEDLLGDGRLLKTVVVEGSGPVPVAGKRVEVNYETRLAATGRKIDSSWDEGEVFDFILGDGQVLEAWDIGVATMKPGEKSKFIADSSLAYGDDDAGDDIPASAVLEFTIELVSGIKKQAPSAADAAQQKAQKKSTLPGEVERYKRAEQAKANGNNFVHSGNFSSARRAYQEALSLLRTGFVNGLSDVSDGENNEVSSTTLELLRSANQLRLSCLLNLAQCDLKLGDHKAAEQNACEALDLDSTNCKALYRRGVARLVSGDLPEAKADLLKASQLDPRNTEIRRKLEECQNKLTACAQWQKSAYGGIFGKAPEQQVKHRNLADLPRAWLDVQIGSGPVTRVVIALYSDTAPRTAENFRCLCTGERGIGRCGQPLHYRHTLVHKVIRRAVIEAGDVQKYDGTGGESIYGPTFDDESFQDTHHKRGLLSMASHGSNTNNSKFFFTLRSLPEFDGKHVVFGEVIDGSKVLDTMESVETEYPDWPLEQISIVHSGDGAGPSRSGP